MPVVAKVVSAWVGVGGDSPQTGMYFQGAIAEAWASADTTAAAAAVRAFWNSSVTILSTVVTVQVRGTCSVYDEESGVLLDEVPGTTPAAVNGTASGAFSAAAGACVTWRTTVFHQSRRITGRTFLVPAGGTALQSDGTLATTPLGALQTASNNLIAAGPPTFGVWHRPHGSPGVDGLFAPAASATITDQTAVLRSRR